MVNIFFYKIILNFCLREVFFLLPFPQQKSFLFFSKLKKKLEKNQNLHKIRYFAKLEMRVNKYYPKFNPARKKK